jgi:hypothetical protein
MQIQIKTHIGIDLIESKIVIDRLVWENLSKKLDQYLNKFDKNDSEGLVELYVEKNKKSLFNWKIQANLDGKSYRFEREDYKNLDDLINHLFDNFKQSLSDEK